MSDLRTAALDAAIRAHAHQRDVTGGPVEPTVIVTAAVAYLAFLDPGVSVAPISLEKPPTKKALKAAAVTAESAASLTAPAGQAAVTATPAATVTAPVTSTATPISAHAANAPAQQAAAAAGVSNLVAPPTTIQLAAESLKALVQDKSPGRGREVAVALLKEFEVEQLAQIPAPKLAEFKLRCDTAGKTAAPAAGVAHDPTGGLLG